MIVDFDASGLDNAASWVLDLPDDLDSPVQGSLVLLINSNDTDLVAAASGKRDATQHCSEHLYHRLTFTPRYTGW